MSKNANKGHGFTAIPQASNDYPADSRWGTGFGVEDGIAAKTAGLAKARAASKDGEITEPSPGWQQAERDGVAKTTVKGDGSNTEGFFNTTGKGNGQNVN
jgi:hypothetical protein